MEHCLSTAFDNLPMQRSKIGFIPTSSIINGQRSISPFISSRRNDPPRLCQHHNMKEVGDLNKVDTLPLNWEGYLSYHSLKSANTAFVTTPIGFISYEENAIL